MNTLKHTLQNPVWYALEETHKKHIIQFDGVKFYNPDICPFGAFKDSNKTKNAVNAYSKLTKSFFLVTEYGIPVFNNSMVVLNKKIEGCQMVLQTLNKIEITEKIIPLTSNYEQAIYDLIWLVMPGYYRKRSLEMGQYYGIFKDNILVAVAGQRMQTNHFIEISGVVTHPSYTRKGYAKQLITHIAEKILKANKQPILHTTKGNFAITLYEYLGFSITRDMNWWHFNSK